VGQFIFGVKRGLMSCPGSFHNPSWSVGVGEWVGNE